MRSASTGATATARRAGRCEATSTRTSPATAMTGERLERQPPDDPVRLRAHQGLGAERAVEQAEQDPEDDRRRGEGHRLLGDHGPHLAPREAQ